MKHEWVKVVERRGQSVLISSYFYNGIQSKFFRKTMNFPWGLDHYLIVDFVNYYRRDEVERFQRFIERSFRQTDFRRLEEDLHKLDVVSDPLLMFAKSVGRLPLQKLRRDALPLFKRFSQLCLAFGPAMYYPILIEPIVEEEVRRLIERRIGNRANEYFKLFTSTDRPTEGTHELISLYSIARVYRRRARLDRHVVYLIDKHLARFRWLSFTKFVGKSWTRSTIISRILRIAPNTIQPTLRNLRSTYNSTRQQTRKAFDRLSLTDRDRSFVLLAQRLAHFRTYRIDVYTEAGFYMKNVFRVIARRLGLSLNELVFLSYPEIIRSLKDGRKFPWALARRRMTGKWQLLFSKGKMTFTYRPPYLVDSHERLKISEVRGTTAYPGFVRATVKIIRGVIEFKKMKEGAVLVSSMTTPDFVPLMERASAIVTDEGGMTCHAAIVSREMKKPCIVGTKVATRVLKDGDRVEVDADRGIVRKL